MYVDNEQILGACLPILRQVRADGDGDGEHTFLTTQQIWIALVRKRHKICDQLIHICRRGQASEQSEVLGRITDALTDAPYIETRYLDTRYVLFDPMEAPAFGAGGLNCQIFRLR